MTSSGQLGDLCRVRVDLCHLQAIVRPVSNELPTFTTTRLHCASTWRVVFDDLVADIDHLGASSPAKSFAAEIV